MIKEQRLSLLFVEDDKEIQSAILSFLHELSFKNIYKADNGVEGLEQFYLYRPDIVITDLSMPFMSGLELARKIKKHSSEVPVVLITSKFEKEVTEDAVDIGVDAYLFKPISFDRLEKVLLEQIQRVLDRHKFLSERKLLEQYKSALDLSAAVSKTDKFGFITYVNDSFCLMSGYAQEELIGKRHKLVRHPETPKALYIDLWRTINSKKVWRGRIKNLKKDRTAHYVELIIIPILNEKNAIVEFIAILQDVTDHYNQELYLKRRIAEEVEKNTHETKYSTIGRMAAGITHEINTPLTYIKGNVELMSEDIAALSDAIEQKQYLLEDARVISEGVNRIASIVESMREIASQGKTESKAGNVYDSLITALTLAHNKSKQITEVYLQNTPFFVGMPKEKFHFLAMMQAQRIEQVWVIIINNALDVLKQNREEYSQRLLEITIEREDDFIVVRFLDNGGGIDEAFLPKIFEPFESTKEEGGIGIGLNIAKKIIEDHNGKIVASNYENGALFEVYLPRC